MKHQTVADYAEQLQAYNGSVVYKCKQCVEFHSDDWLLEDESLLIDILDDKSMTADDVVEALQSICELEEEPTRSFKAAITAMRLYVKRDHQAADVQIVVQQKQKSADESMLSGVLPPKQDLGLSQGLTSLI